MTTVNDDAYAEVAEQQAGDNVLVQIAQTALAIQAAKNEVDRCQAALKAAQAALRTLEVEVMVELMDAAAQKKVTTADDLKVELKDMVRASIPNATADEAFRYLEATGAGAIIKNRLQVLFPKGQDELARKEQDRMIALGLHPTAKRFVETQTLQALIRERLVQGIQVPLETLGAETWRQAVVTSNE